MLGKVEVAMRVFSLSDKQQKILSFLRTFIEDKGYPPSIRDIQAACRISSTSVVDYNLRILERGGHIRRDPEVSRGIEILDEAGARPRLLRVPVLGQVAAGDPIPVPNADTWNPMDWDDTVEISEEMVHGQKEVFALKVKGTSMIDALINDGDVVLMQSSNTVEDGQMAAVWFKDRQETTLKRVYREGGRIRLQPANVQMEPIFAESESIEVQGKVLGVIRRV